MERFQNPRVLTSGNDEYIFLRNGETIKLYFSNFQATHPAVYLIPDNYHYPKTFW